MEFTSNSNSTTQFTEYVGRPAPSYAHAASQLPPPPPFEAALATPTGSHADLMSLEHTPSYGDYGTPTYGSPMKADRAPLDLTKFRTKLCKNFVNGVPCPFEERCAFAHGYEEQALGKAMSPPPPKYHAAFASTPTSALPSLPVSNAASSGASSDVDAAEARNTTPPAYPTRYRHDPYNLHTAVVYAQ